MDESLRLSGFTALDADACVYKCDKDSSFIIISLYVDDLLLFSNSRPSLTAFKAVVSSVFHMKDLGEAKFVLGIEIIRDRSQRTTSLSQAAYVRDMLLTYDMTATSATDVPVQAGVRQAPPDIAYTAPLRDTRRYQAAVGALMFAAVCTRPDISFAVGQLSQYASNPDTSHKNALTQVFRYLRGAIDYRVLLQGHRSKGGPTNSGGLQ